MLICQRNDSVDTWVLSSSLLNCHVEEKLALVSVVQGQNEHKDKNNNKKQMHRGHFYLIIKKSIKQFVNEKGFLMMDAVTSLPCSDGTYIGWPWELDKTTCGTRVLNWSPWSSFSKTQNTLKFYLKHILGENIHNCFCLYVLTRVKEGSNPK